jgi:hypothetical protein
MPLLALYALVLPCAAGCLAHLLRRYPAPDTPLAALLATALSFAAAISVTLLVPLDVYWLYAPGGTGPGGVAAASWEALRARARLAVAWNVAYWASVAATVVLPLLQARAARCVRAACAASLLLHLPRPRICFLR